MWIWAVSGLLVKKMRLGSRAPSSVLLPRPSSSKRVSPPSGPILSAILLVHLHPHQRINSLWCWLTKEGTHDYISREDYRVDLESSSGFKGWLNDCQRDWYFKALETLNHTTEVRADS